MIATLQAISPALATKLTHERIAFLKAAAQMQAELDLVMNTLRASADAMDCVISGGHWRRHLPEAAGTARCILEKIDAQEKQEAAESGGRGDPAGDETDREPEGRDRGGGKPMPG